MICSFVSRAFFIVRPHHGPDSNRRWRKDPWQVNIDTVRGDVVGKGGGASCARWTLPIRMDMAYTRPCGRDDFAYSMEFAMKRSNILAHRGYWANKAEQNSSLALNRAVDAGFGLETDVRDRAGLLVISHDPPESGSLLSAGAFFEYFAKAKADCRLAINVKADGLQKKLLDALQANCLDQGNLFVFDMAVPDALHYLRLGVPTYTRISEYEKQPTFLDEASGVWIDSFTGGFPQVAEAQRLMQMGYRVCIVSSELHGRDHRPLWAQIIEAQLHKNPLFEICTDFPQIACDIFEADDR